MPEGLQADFEPKFNKALFQVAKPTGRQEAEQTCPLSKEAEPTVRTGQAGHDDNRG
ncbi:MAG: hypothetical protein AB1393_03645 [Candidatus Edwardsbacteria bacterium]